MRSAPAQKARPEPVMMPTRREGSASRKAKSASSSRWPAMLMQLRNLGRERVMRRMCGAGNVAVVKEVGGRGREKRGGGDGIVG